MNQFLDDITAFHEFGTHTVIDSLKGNIPIFINEFWTAKQRAGHSLHEISYRACYKPQLPAFFITRLTQPGDTVYDPFLGRGTTLIQAQLLDRIPIGNDANPLCRILASPRLHPPTLTQIRETLQKIQLPPSNHSDIPDGLHAFFHPETLREILGWRAYFQQANPKKSDVDAWLEMVAVNRLTGHSPGFFSVYTLPPNQAVTVQRQIKINKKRQQTPSYRDTKKILLKKSQTLLRNPLPTDYTKRAKHSQIHTGPADHTPHIPNDSISLIVTSPPFLNVVNYGADNWLRNWFVNLPPGDLWQSSSLPKWLAQMENTFRELHRILKPGGIIAFEVGEVRKGTLPLDQELTEVSRRAQLHPVGILINQQDFTKTAHCWGINNNQNGTNTNRVILLTKPTHP